MSKIKRYKDYIKSLPCAVCQDDTRVDQHHLINIPGITKGVSNKLPEILSIPLCRKHHDALHADLKEFELWYTTQTILLAQTLVRAQIDGEINVH